MVQALKWALSMITGIPLEGAARPSRSLLWLSVGYGLLGLLVLAVCGLPGWMCLALSNSNLLSALFVSVLYWLLTWKLLPMSRGGEYLLSGLLVQGGAGDSYDAYRRLSLYMGLLIFRGLAILGVSCAFGAGWILPLMLLGGCTVSEAIRQRVSGGSCQPFRGGDWSHWYVAWGVSILSGGLLGGGSLLVLCVLASGLSFTGAFLLERLPFQQLDMPSLRRVWWTVSELALLCIGLLGWFL